MFGGFKKPVMQEWTIKRRADFRPERNVRTDHKPSFLNVKTVDHMLSESPFRDVGVDAGDVIGPNCFQTDLPNGVVVGAGIDLGIKASALVSVYDDDLYFHDMYLI